MLRHTNSLIHILYVIDNLGPGGAQRQLLELLKGRDKMGVEVEVCSLSLNCNELLAEFERIGIKVHLIHQQGKFSLSTLAKLYFLMKRNKYDVVHTYLFTADLYGRIAAKLAGVRYIVSSSRSTDFYKKKHHVIADRILSYFTDKIIANACAVKEVLIKREKINSNKIEVIYNGINWNYFYRNGRSKESAKQALGFSPQTELIANIGRLGKEKDQITFLRAGKVISEKHRDVKFLLIGKGDMEDILRQKVKELGIENKVIFLGLRRDIVDILYAVDVLILSSIYEGCSNVIMEAMACGVPVIATNVGGNPELIKHGITGFLVEVGDYEKIAEYTIKLLKDKELAMKMGNEAQRIIAEEFSNEKLWRETRKIYQELPKVNKRR